MGLLFLNYLIRKNGHETLYLGQSTPLLSVININNQWQADLIVTGLFSEYSKIKPSDFLMQLHKSFPEQKILVTGLLKDALIKNVYTNIFAINSSEDLRTYL